MNESQKTSEAVVRLQALVENLSEKIGKQNGQVVDMQRQLIDRELEETKMLSSIRELIGKIDRLSDVFASHQNDYNKLKKDVVILKSWKKYVVGTAVTLIGIVLALGGLFFDFRGSQDGKHSQNITETELIRLVEEKVEEKVKQFAIDR